HSVTAARACGSTSLVASSSEASRTTRRRLSPSDASYGSAWLAPRKAISRAMQPPPGDAHEREHRTDTSVGAERLARQPEPEAGPLRGTRVAAQPRRHRNHLEPNDLSEGR